MPDPQGSTRKYYVHTYRHSASHVEPATRTETLLGPSPSHIDNHIQRFAGRVCLSNALIKSGFGKQCISSGSATSRLIYPVAQTDVLTSQLTKTIKIQHCGRNITPYYSSNNQVAPSVSGTGARERTKAHSGQRSKAAAYRRNKFAGVPIIGS